MAQPQSITSSTTAKGAVPTQGVTMGHIYAAVDYSRYSSGYQGNCILQAIVSPLFLIILKRINYST